MLLNVHILLQGEGNVLKHTHTHTHNLYEKNLHCFKKN